MTDFGAEAAEMLRHRVLQLAVEDRYDTRRTDVYICALELGRESPGLGITRFEVIGNLL